MMACFWWYLDPLSPHNIKTLVKLSWTPLTNFSGSAHDLALFSWLNSTELQDKYMSESYKARKIFLFFSILVFMSK